ncbi:hypothetical protein IVB27_26770 [Bradyrhizobium sp. 197]|uniref:hypothetical protein n=1 Tax=Bradyrhizobium sp. 197 TaxID=2782663 RepID=UPI001FF8696A|nr:hypothetical protein [Bradyrhizobium sp. 197]MCK1478303.1 hypothetical protein [Bradyrhizobium sp. 197]
MPETTTAAAWLIFLATYAVVALGKIPVYRIDRAGAALLGGSLIVASGVLSLEEAYQAVDFNTIALLLARRAARHTCEHGKTPAPIAKSTTGESQRNGRQHIPAIRNRQSFV